MRQTIRSRPMLTLLLCLAAALAVLIAVAHVEADAAERSRIDDVAEADPVPAPLEATPELVVDTALRRLRR